MKRSAAASLFAGLLAALPAFGAAPIVRSGIEVTPPSRAVTPQPVLSVEDRLQLLERRMQALTDILMRLDRIQQETQQLRGDIELQGHLLKSLKKRQRDLYADMDRRLTQLMARPAPAAPPSPPVAPVVPPSAPALSGTASSPVQAPGASAGTVASGEASVAASPETETQAAGGVPVKDLSAPSVEEGVAPPAGTVPAVAAAPAPVDPALEKAAYKQAFDLLMQRRYGEAKQAFRTFLQQYPGGHLAANAQYWVGEASYVMRDFDTALGEFTKVVQNYPESAKVADSLLKIAFIQYEQKAWAKARKTLERIIEQHAASTAARLARKRLERMRIEGN